jgi:hypothetical protein
MALAAAATQHVENWQCSVPVRCLQQARGCNLFVDDFQVVATSWGYKHEGKKSAAAAPEGLAASGSG